MKEPEQKVVGAGCKELEKEYQALTEQIENYEARIRHAIPPAGTLDELEKKGPAIVDWELLAQNKTKVEDLKKDRNEVKEKMISIGCTGSAALE